MLLKLLLKTIGPVFKKLYFCCQDFTELGKFFKILLILSHDQAQIGCDFSTNAKLPVENQYTESLMAEKIIPDHMRCHKHQPHTIKIIPNSKAGLRYFSRQQNFFECGEVSVSWGN